MNDLLCCEVQSSLTENTRAHVDPSLFNDKRVLENLLKTEERYTLPICFLKPGRTEISPAMRKIVVEWMMEVCEDQKCQDEVFLMAVNLMDRFLSGCEIDKSQMQLLASACMLIASKLREPKPLSADILVFYTDNSIKRRNLRSWENLVLSHLKWDVSAITPIDFLSHLMRHIPIEEVGMDYDRVRNHAKTLATLCAAEYKLSYYTPSIIAAGCLASSLLGLGWCKFGRSEMEVLQILHDITLIEPDYLSSCLQEIERMVFNAHNNEGTQGLMKDDVEQPRPDEFTPPPTTSAKFAEHESAGTPTDVRDVHF